MSFDCEECGSPLMPVASGSVCPNGCGRLHAKLPRDIAIVNSARISGIANARLQPDGHYAIEGRSERFDRMSPARRVVSRFNESRPDGIVLAILNGEAVYKFEAARTKNRVAT